MRRFEIPSESQQGAAFPVGIGGDTEQGDHRRGNVQNGTRLRDLARRNPFLPDENRDRHVFGEVLAVAPFMAAVVGSDDQTAVLRQQRGGPLDVAREPMRRTYAQS